MKPLVFTKPDPDGRCGTCGEANFKLITQGNEHAYKCVVCSSLKAVDWRKRAKLASSSKA